MYGRLILFPVLRPLSSEPNVDGVPASRSGLCFSWLEDAVVNGGAMKFLFQVPKKMEEGFGS